MVKRTGPTNPRVRKLVELLKAKWLEMKAPIWRDIMERIQKPTRKRIEVNLGKINKYAKEGETIVVPGVVLGGGKLEKRVTIAALRFSSKAKEKAEKVGCKCISIEELIELNKRGSNIRIMG